MALAVDGSGPSAVDESTAVESPSWEPGGPLPPLRLLALSEGRLSSHALPRAGRAVIGRQRGVAVRLDHGSVSRRHAELVVEETRLALRDLDSQNGTTVNGRRLGPGEELPLGPEDVVRVGSVTLLVRAVEPLGAEAPRDLAGPVDAPPGLFCGEWLLGHWTLVTRIAAGEIPVLLTGETGVGKEVVARLIHERSRRARGPLVTVNCAAIPAGLLESEVFGHARGAFTGAGTTTAGVVERADGGTLFLDEIGELPVALQAKMLRVLESGEYRRVGGATDLRSDVRVVAATNRDLDAAAESGAFRQDLLFRINGFTLVVPPLRERRDEIEGLARHFARATADAEGLEAPELTPEALAALQGHDWPGNVRELRNAIARAVLVAAGRPIDVRHLPEPFGGVPGASPPRAGADTVLLRDAVRQAEARRIVEALRQCDGNQTKAARLLGVSRRTLISRLDELGLPRPRKKPER